MYNFTYGKYIKSYNFIILSCKKVPKFFYIFIKKLQLKKKITKL